jgi:hypothetical protein
MNDSVDRLSGVSVPSHRAALRAQLAVMPVEEKHPVRRAALAFGMVCLALVALTAAYPTWATDLVRFVKTGEKNVKGPDGATYHQETYRMEGGNGAGSGTVQLRANANGEITSHSEQAGVDPALAAMKSEAERAVQSGHARLLWESDGMRAYHITLADGRAITYIQGPGTSWSVSQ